MRRMLASVAWMGAGAGLVAAALFLRISFVGGSSMEPTLVRGDVCLVARWLEPQVGDVVLFALPGHGPVLHRVERRLERGVLRTRGDANARVDREPVAPTYIRGCVVGVLPLGKAARGWWHATGSATLLTRSR